MSAKRAKMGRAFRLAVLELVLLLLGMLFVRRDVWEFRASLFTVNYWQEGMLIPFAAVDGAITGAYGSRSRFVQHLPAYRKTLRWATPGFFFLYVACCALCERLHVGLFPFAPEFWRTLGLAIVVFGLLLRVWSAMSAPSALIAAGTTAVEEGEQPGSETDLAAPAQTPAQAETATVETQKSAQTPTETTASQPSQAQDVTPVEPFLPLQPTPKPAAGEIFPTGPHRWLRHPDASGKLIALIGLPLVFNSWIPLLALPGVFVLLKWHISDQEAFRISQLGEPYLRYRKGTWNLIPYVY